MSSTQPYPSTAFPRWKAHLKPDFRIPESTFVILSPGPPKTVEVAVRTDSVFSYQQGCFGDSLGSQCWIPANNRQRSTFPTHLLRGITFQPSNFPGILIMDCEEVVLLGSSKGPWAMSFHVLPSSCNWAFSLWNLRRRKLYIPWVPITHCLSHFTQSLFTPHPVYR